MSLKFFKLGLRNILLYRRRSILTGSVMVFSVTAIIFAAAMGEAFYRQLVDVGIRTTTGHLQVLPKDGDFDILNPMAGNIPKITDANSVESIISQAPFYKAHGKEIMYQMLLYDKTDVFFQGTIIGVEPDKFKATLSGTKLIEGEDIVEGVRDGILISNRMKWYFEEMSVNHKLQANDTMYVITGGPMGMMEGFKTKFTGVVEYMPLFRGQAAYTNLKRVQGLLGWKNDMCTSVKIMLTDKDKTEETRKWLQAEFAARNLELKVLDWRELGGFYYHIALIGRFLVFVLLLILALITAVSVLNTMLMSVRERTREIGTMMALGIKKRGLLSLFLTESFVLSLISSSVGLLVGLSLVFWFQNRGIVEGLVLVLEKKLFPVPEVLPAVFSFLWILVTGTVGGWYPAHKAANLDPITALRHV